MSGYDIRHAGGHWFKLSQTSANLGLRFKQAALDLEQMEEFRFHTISESLRAYNIIATSLDKQKTTEILPQNSPFDLAEFVHVWPGLLKHTNKLPKYRLELTQRRNICVKIGEMGSWEKHKMGSELHRYMVL